MNTLLDKISSTLPEDPEEALRALTDIQYQQCFNEALEMFKTMSPDKIAKICEAKEKIHKIDYDHHDPDNSTYEEKLKILMDAMELQAYQDAGKQVLSLGTVN